MPLQYPVLYRSMDARQDAIVANAVATAVADAEKLWSPERFDGPFPKNGFGIAKLRALEFGLADSANSYASPYSAMWAYSQATASAWATWISATLSTDCYVVITGFFNLDASPDVECVKFIADGIEYPIIDLTEMDGWDIATAYFSHPIIVRPTKKIVIKVKARTVGLKFFGLLGYVVAKRSYLINEV